MLAYFPINVSGIGPYPDFLALFITCIIIALMIIGVKESSLLNRVFTLFNVALLSVIIVTGATKADFSNWSLRTNVNFIKSV
jgi:cationic amino acid transporter 3